MGAPGPEAPPLLVGVAGGSGSGKTTLVQGIVSGLGSRSVRVLSHDAYYRGWAHLPVEEREAVNFDHPDALETPLLLEHLRALAAGRPVEIPVYDFATHARSPETRRMEPGEVLLLEGTLILAVPELRELLEVRIFVDADPDVRFIRRLRRDLEERGRTVESVVAQYLATVRPMHLEFVEPSRRHAHLIVPGGGRNRVAVDTIVSKLADLRAARERSRPS